MTSSGYRESSSSVLAIGTGGESIRMATVSMRKSDNHMGVRGLNKDNKVHDAIDYSSPTQRNHRGDGNEQQPIRHNET